jgi:hypothetical protein
MPALSLTHRRFDTGSCPGQWAEEHTILPAWRSLASQNLRKDFNMNRLDCMSEHASESVPVTVALSSVWRDVWGTIRACCGISAFEATPCQPQLQTSRQQLVVVTLPIYRFYVLILTMAEQLNGEAIAKPRQIYHEPTFDRLRPSNASVTPGLVSQGDQEQLIWDTYDRKSSIDESLESKRFSAWSSWFRLEDHS